MTRQFLVTTFACSQCGAALEVENQGTRKHLHVDDGITGAEKVIYTIAIKPCRVCYSKAREPSALMAKALRSLGDLEAETGA